MKAGEFIFHFGKHKGRSLNDVYTIDKRYLRWILKEFKPGTVLNVVQKFLNKAPNMEIDFEPEELPCVTENEPVNWEDNKKREVDPWNTPNEWDDNDIPF